MHRVTVKTSTIFIAKRGPTQVYRSVGEIPAKLRKEIRKLDSKRGKGWRKISDAEYLAAVKELIDDALYQQEFDETMAAQLLAEATQSLT